MDHIIVIFHPFEVEQEVMVYQRGECVKQAHPCLNDVINIVHGLNEQYHADRIELCGNPAFVRKYVKDLKTTFALDKHPTIEIIPR